MTDRDDLSDLFAQAQGQAAQPSDALMARVLHDAIALQPAPHAAGLPQRAPAPPPMPTGFWAALTGLFGGGGALAGIGSAAVVGLVIGVLQPSQLTSFTDALLGAPIETVQMIPSLDQMLTEE